MRITYKLENDFILLVDFDSGKMMTLKLSQEEIDFLSKFIYELVDKKVSLKE
jgi:hypothetical protein